MTLHPRSRYSRTDHTGARGEQKIRVTQKGNPLPIAQSALTNSLVEQARTDGESHESSWRRYSTIAPRQGS